MKLVSRLSVAVALGLGSAALTTAPAMAQALSPAVGKPLTAAQRAAAGGNTGAAISNINSARAAAKTAAERTAVAKMAGYVYTRAGQYGRAAQELETVGAPASQLAPLYYQANNCSKATQLAQRAGLRTIVAQCQLKTGNFKGAVATYQALVKSNPSNRSYLENLAGAQYKSGDKTAYLATTEKLVRLDPSPERWRTLLVNLKGEKMPREAKLALFELMKQTNNLTRADEYQEYAKLAIVGNMPGVAKQALDAAQKANAIQANDPMASGLIRAANERTLQAQAGVAKAPPLLAGNTYFGAGNYPAAVAAYSRAGDAPATKLQLGIAQLRAGNAGAARTTFRSIAQGTPVADVASLWALYASTRSA